MFINGSLTSGTVATVSPTVKTKTSPTNATNLVFLEVFFTITVSAILFQQRKLLRKLLPIECLPELVQVSLVE